MTKLKLKIEELEERIAPSLVVDPSGVSGGHSNVPADTGPTDLHPSTFPSILHAGQDGAWNAHFNSPVITGPGDP